MSENKNQNGEQQPSVVTVKYVVSKDLKYIEDQYYYVLYREDFIEDSFMISLNDIVLAPAMTLEFKIEKENFSFRDENIIKFNYEYLLNYSYCNLKDYDFISFYVFIDLYYLNRTHSGIIVSKKDKDVTSNNYHEISFYYDPVYEVKLDEPIIVETIRRKFTRIYLLSKDLLIGNRIENFKINPLSLFNNNNNAIHSKPVLYTCSYKRDDVLSKDDLALLKKDNFYSKFNRIALGVFQYAIFITFLINLALNKSIFTPDWTMIIPVFLSIGWFYFLQTDKVRRNKNYDINYKDHLIDKINEHRIISTIAGGIIIFYLLFAYTKNYKYESEFVYDTKQKVFLEDNSFVVPNSLFLKTSKIVDRFKPVYAKYTIDLIFNDPRKLFTSESRLIDLEVDIEFNKGNFLLNKDFDLLLNTVKLNLQYKLSNGDYGNLAIENQFDYDRSIIDIKEDLYKELISVLGIDSSDISSVKITTKYAKLHNVD